MKVQLPLLALTAIGLASSAPASAAPADYHDASEMEAAVDALDGAAGGRVQVHTVGMTPDGHRTRAIHLAALGFGGQPPADSGDKPALLIECGMHAREWAAPQSCLLFAQSFVLASFLDPSRVDDILANADIWILPMVNPDGRDMDDTGGGDPLDFWSSTFFHPATSSDLSGWRDNAQTVSCPAGPGGSGVGIDLNRAFSSGWDDGQDNCLNNQFHGDYPFEGMEARILRRFVNNRMISMSLSVHSFSPCVGGQNGDRDVHANFADVWNDAVSDPDLELSYNAGSCEGRGVGQFTAWMARSSDTPFERDFGTNRGAASMLLELPPSATDYNNATILSPYRDSLGDASNPFHPSDHVFMQAIAPGVFDSLMYLAAQARSPWCAIDPVTLLPDASCTRDFGLTGSKIADCEDCIGALRFRDNGSEAIERMPADDRSVVYRVQNFDTTSNGNVQATVVITSRPAGVGTYSTDLVNAQTYVLGAGDGVTDSVPFSFVAGRDYMVQVLVRPLSYGSSLETEDDNDKHLFRFETF